ncbi:MAG: GNAT family N-acetyltransferase [Oscillospiraceae bacterium]|nr:GNAT family N-acetyltransferase [Oscillospiraceae bacterium]
MRLAEKRDFEILHRNDKHISAEILKKKISDKNILIAEMEEKFAGWLRYNFFWDEIPFMNMLFVIEKFRGVGIGGKLVREWEKLMSEQGYKTLLTSTQANEYAQHFYRKQGYKDLGGFALFGEEYEIILGKQMEK